VAASLQLAADAPDSAIRPLRAMEQEVESLRQEVQMLRRRDEVVHFYLQRLDEEMRLAARLQQDFLPKELPRVGAARFQALFRPAGYVSGDLYDVFRLDETHVGFYLADAIGHGVPSALLTMFLRTSLISKEILSGSYRILTPGEALGRLNMALAGQDFSLATFATAIYGIINVVSGEVRLSRAGHPSPTLVPGRGDQEIGDADIGGGALLGVFPEEVYPSGVLTLAPGDRLFVHSDGIELVFDGEPDADSDLRWKQELADLRGMETQQLLAEFSRRLDRECGSLAPKDDLTIIAVEMAR
jgi:phosphoserine phosphatase RsbU/P